MKTLIAFLIIIVFNFSIAQGQQKMEWLDINLSNYEYPHHVDYIQINIQNQSLKMAYMDIRPEHHNGKNVMLLHGKNFNGAYWRTTIKALSENGYRVIVPDQIGFGKSSKPKNFHYTFHQLALNTKSLLDSLGVSRTVVLGHSMGGMLATRFALMFPEATEKLVLENPIGLEDWKLKVPYQPVDWWYNNELKKDYAQIREYQRTNYYNGDWKPEYDEWAELLAGWTLNSD